MGLAREVSLALLALGCLPVVLSYTTLYNTHLMETTDLPSNGSHGDGHHGGVHLVSWNFDYVSGPLGIAVVILFAGLMKLAFHYAFFLSSIIPESCVLIVVGTIMGVIFYYGFDVHEIQLSPRNFLLFLLPPIVLEAAYSLNDRVFMQNLGSILIYAVIGTIISFLIMGPALYGLAISGAMGDIDITFVQCLLFASFIVAVDPVAVLAIFQEVGVNNVLYFLVFGESLLNDAVTVVLSSMMKAFNEMEDIPPSQIGLGVGSFFTISLGGLAIGIVFGMLTALITRATRHVRVVEPLAILLMAYLSYIVAELFHWSGIISMIGCGLVQAQYAFHNISHKSHITVEYFIKMLASVMDAVIFLFLGLELIKANHVWHTGFILWSLLLCLVIRLITVFGLTFIVNRVDRVHPIKLEEQFIMWYGGLRGAVCFALAATIHNNFVHKDLFLTATFVVIMFTVFIQGITIKPLVGLCHIARKADEPSMLIEELQIQMSDNIMAGVELIIDQAGQNYFRSRLSHINNTYLRRWLQSDPLTQDQRILHVYQDVAIMDYKHAVRGGVPYSKSGPSEAFSSRLSAMPEFNHLEYDQSILRNRRLSLAGSPVGYGSLQRGSFMSRMTGQRTTGEVTSVTDFRRLLRMSRFGSDTLHQRYDPDIVRDSDLSSHLHERSQRLSRYVNATMGSQQHIPQFHAPHSARSPSNASDFSQNTQPRVSYRPGSPDYNPQVNIELRHLKSQDSRNGSGTL